METSTNFSMKGQSCRTNGCFYWLHIAARQIEVQFQESEMGSYCASISLALAHMHGTVPRL